MGDAPCIIHINGSPLLFKDQESIELCPFFFPHKVFFMASQLYCVASKGRDKAEDKFVTYSYG